MWKFLYQMASPKSFYYLSQALLPLLFRVAVILLSIGLLWGLVLAPADYQQGDAFRIIYIHVPAAFMSMALYMAMAFCSLLLLVWQLKLAGFFLKSIAEVGVLMTLLALLTGAIWGRPMWGTWWIWDARLTSELILLLLYLAILALASAYKTKEHSDKLIAILTLVGIVDLPVIHYSVYWWQTLHQGSSLSLFAKPKIALPMLYPLLITLAGFIVYCLWAVLHKAGSTLLLREKRKLWVQMLFEEKCL